MIPSFKYIGDIENLTVSYTVFFIDSDTCEHYGAIKAALRKKGKSIPENDIWIVAMRATQLYSSYKR